MTAQKPTIPPPSRRVPRQIPRPAAVPIPLPVTGESSPNDSETTVQIGSLPRLGFNWGMEGFLLADDEGSQSDLETSELTRSNSDADMTHRTSVSESGERTGVVFGRFIVVQRSDSDITTAVCPSESETDTAPSLEEDKKAQAPCRSHPISVANTAFGSSSTLVSTSDLGDHDPDATFQGSPRYLGSRTGSIVGWRDDDFEKLSRMLSGLAKKAEAGSP